MGTVVNNKKKKRWMRSQSEANKDLTGPSHQLFKALKAPPENTNQKKRKKEKAGVTHLARSRRHHASTVLTVLHQLLHPLIHVVSAA